MSIDVTRITAEVSVDQAKALAELAALDAATSAAAQDKTAHIRIKIDQDIQLAGMSELLARLEADANSASGGMNRFGSSARTAGGAMGMLGIAMKGVMFGGIYTLATAAAGGIQMLGAAASGAVGALGPLAGLLATLPVGLSALVAGGGSTFLGISGLADGYTQMGLAMGESAATASVLARRQRELAAAQRGYQEALMGVTRAQREMRDAEEAAAEAPQEARERLEDLRISAAGAILAQKQAVLSLAAAQKNLNSAQKDSLDSATIMSQETDAFSGKIYEVARISASAVSTAEEQQQSQLALEQAKLSLRSANRGVEESQEKLTEAEGKGIKNSDIVIEANERLVDADFRLKSSHDAVTAAIERIAEARRQMALESVGGVTDNKAYLAAMAKLSPAAKNFLNFIRDDFAPSLKDLRFQAQEGLLPGAERGLTQLMEIFPMLGDKVKVFSRISGNAFGDFMEWMTTKKNKSGMSDMLDQLSWVWRRMLRAGRPLFKILMNLNEAAFPLMQTALRGINSNLRKFAGYLDSDKGKKETTTFFEKTAKFMGLWGDALGPLFRIFSAFMKATEPLATWMMKGMAEGFDNVADSMESVAGMKGMKDFFRSMKPALSETLGMVKDFFDMLFSVDAGGKDSAFTTTIKAVRESLIPAIGDLLQALSDSDFGPKFVDFLSGLVDGIGALAANDGVFTLIVDFVGGLARGLSRLSDATNGQSTKWLLAALVGISAFKIGSKVLGMTGLGGLYTGLKNVETRAATAKTALRRVGVIAGAALLMDSQNRLPTNSKGRTATGENAIGTMEAAGGGALLGATAGSMIAPGVGTVAGGIIGGAAGAMFHLAQNTKDAGAAAKDAKPKFADLRDTLDQVTGATTKATRSMIVNSMQGDESDMLAAGRALGLSTKTMVDAMMGRKKAEQEIQDTMAYWDKQGMTGGMVPQYTDDEGLKQGAMGPMRGFWENAMVYQAAKQDQQKQINAVQDWKALLGKIPPKVKTKLTLAGYDLTMGNAVRMANKFDLVGQERKAFFKLVGLKEVDRDTRELNRSLNHAARPRQIRMQIAQRELRQSMRGAADLLGGFFRGLPDMGSPSDPGTTGAGPGSPGGMNDAIDWDLGRQYGGEVDKGKSYVVGEKRAEVFVPSSNGRIVQQNSRTAQTAMGQGQNVSQADLERIVERLIDSTRTVNVEQVFNEKVDPQHMGKELAWRMR